jgi:hypothetical protein
MSKPKNSDGAAFEPSKPRTALGKQLMSIRKKIVASGEPLLSWDGIERGVAERRGEVKQ